MTRTACIEKLAAGMAALSLGHPTRVAIDGVDGVGKTSGRDARLAAADAVTGAVPRADDARWMQDDSNRLHPGADIRCPHCRQWHAVYFGHTAGTDYTRAMLYFACRGFRFYAGHDGYPSRHPTRAAERAR